jgi:hypothetical protein
LGREKEDFKMDEWKAKVKLWKERRKQMMMHKNRKFDKEE